MIFKEIAQGLTKSIFTCHPVETFIPYYEKWGNWYLLLTPDINRKQWYYIPPNYDYNQRY